MAHPAWPGPAARRLPEQNRDEGGRGADPEGRDDIARRDLDLRSRTSEPGVVDDPRLVRHCVPHTVA